MDITKSFNGVNYDVVLEGDLNIYSGTYGYNRHALPGGLDPVDTGGAGFSCSHQISETCGDTSTRANYAYWGVTVDNDGFAGYEDGMLHFPEKFCNGDYELICE